MKEFRSKHYIISSIAVSILGLLLFFQNCSGPNLAFKEVSAESVGLGGDPIAETVIPEPETSEPTPYEPIASEPSTPDPVTVEPETPPVIPVPVVCDPLAGTTNSCVTQVEKKQGLLGNIYSYPGGVGVQNYIDHGQKLEILIQMSHLDIPLRSWTEGFTGPNGPLKDEKGEILNEYFALDLRGFLTLKAPMVSGEYQFAIASDDGSILDLNNEVIIDNDGTHSVRWKCTTHPIQLDENLSIPIRVRYYQGPRTEIALQVMMRPYSKSNLPCDRTGGWQTIPSNFLSHQ